MNRFATVLMISLFATIAACGGGSGGNKGNDPGAGDGGGGDGGSGGDGSPQEIDVKFSAQPIDVPLGDTVTLTWSSANATECTAGGPWTGTKALSGKETVTTEQEGRLVYALICTRGSNIRFTSEIVVRVGPPREPSLQVFIDKDRILLGTPIRLHWFATSATTCTASGAWSGTKSSEGTEILTPSAAGELIYTLACSGRGGKAEESQKLKVIAQQFTYVTNALGFVSVYGVDTDSGVLKQIEGSPFPSAGGNPRGIAVSSLAGRLYVVNQGASSIAGFTIDPNTGALKPLPTDTFPSGNSPNAIAVNFVDNMAYVATLNAGLQKYMIDAASGALTPVGPAKPGTGSIAHHPYRNILYTVTDRGIHGYRSDAPRYEMNPFDWNPLSTGGVPVFIAIEPEGKFAYALNSSSNSISAYSIDINRGSLTAIGGGPFAAGPSPTQMTFDGTGKFAYVTNGGNGSVSTFAIDSETGALKSAGTTAPPTGSTLTSIAADTTGKFVYVGSDESSSNYIHAYSIGATGALTEIANSPFTPPGTPTSIVVTY